MLRTGFGVLDTFLGSSRLQGSFFKATSKGVDKAISPAIARTISTSSSLQASSPRSAALQFWAATARFDGSRTALRTARLRTPLRGPSGPRRPFQTTRGHRKGKEERGHSARSDKDEGPLTLSKRLKKLSREYGWTAVGVYLALSVLDFPFCFLLVRVVGTEKIGELSPIPPS